MPSTTNADLKLRDDLTAASTKLRQVGSPDLAAAVDKVLAPGGWGSLRRSEAAAGTSGAALPPNVSIPMFTTDRDTAKRLAEQAGDPLTGVLERGLADFVAGTFEPRVARATRGSGAAQATSLLNLRPDPELMARVRERIAELNEAGRSPKLSVSNVARAVIEHRFQLGQYKPADKAQ
ncbi:hypothetical protein [Streptomyces sp. DH12]|uniref:hypothetical protein n=1 Tax=Streptomyces sp. DH12 TaxID=2857010 RepID=UPI001E5F8C50|nr:hypothetical protein [Streptomyces sp. DH12]